ncbi:hypothetical protein LCGC14_1310630 [marine sediment metagenome]|uniref:Uncharacterized protein n=1 Tax=marine sediment metagenome TaxID=412755 RepID=A0A0F9KMM4_9ZZZZ
MTRAQTEKIEAWIQDLPDSYKSPGDNEFVNSEFLKLIGGYVLFGLEPERIFYFVLTDQHKQAIINSDDDYLESLRGITLLIHNRTPSPCNGSHEIVGDWMAHQGMSGKPEFASVMARYT